jgi:hypothetical protein
LPGRPTSWRARPSAASGPYGNGVDEQASADCVEGVVQEVHRTGGGATSGDHNVGVRMADRVEQQAEVVRHQAAADHLGAAVLQPGQQ